MFSRLNSAVCLGIEGIVVNVETDINQGLPNMNIVGLASTTVLESRERIKLAIINSGYEFPRGRITINLTPAGVRKNGSGMDLPMAIGILASSNLVDDCKAKDFGIVGELSLEGKVLGIDGILPIVMGMMKSGIKKIIVPADNYQETLIIKDAFILPVRSLNSCVELINNGVIEECSDRIISTEESGNKCMLDYSDIRGQENAKRAITVAVTGRHGLLMIGTPGVGKSMLAKRIPTIMPRMSPEERLETAIISSVCGDNNGKGIVSDIRPFRSPHNSIGRAGLLGGGGYPVPGEISRAHNGVLFLDEVCEFDRENIEALRGPVEDKKIVHFRLGTAYSFPCNFQLVMAANPCPCGYFGDPERMCKCSLSQLEHYRRKLSGPMMDRIDIRLSIERASFKQLDADCGIGKSSAEMKADVDKGMNFAKRMGRNYANALMKDADLDRYCYLEVPEKSFMELAYSSFKLSPRSYRKVLKVARTIADIDESERVKKEHLAEAISYRMLEEVNE